MCLTRVHRYRGVGVINYTPSSLDGRILVGYPVYVYKKSKSILRVVDRSQNVRNYLRARLVPTNIYYHDSFVKYIDADRNCT